jgi:2-polyprenyl-3-methyl-5-hydroxy-6-metoxy-1,4-benzoquinol methylase
MNEGHEKLIFTSKGKRIELGMGEIYKASRENDYRDIPERILIEIIQEIKQGKNWRDLVKASFEEKNPWLYKIITSKARALFIEQYPLKKNSLVLDIGSGWGQFALPLGGDNIVCALEPTPERLDFIKAAAHQDRKENKLYFIGEDYLKVNFESKFDYILCIGVLEWVGLFSDNEPQESQITFLKKTKKELKTGGELIIGIENRLGLKYILGANDDHTGLPNISFYEAKLAKEKYKRNTGKNLKVFTYSISEIKYLLKLAGYNDIKIYAAFPDYKIPEMILPIGEETEQYLLNNLILEHDGSNGKKLIFQEEIKSLYNSLSLLGIASNFVPSFYIAAR